MPKRQHKYRKTRTYVEIKPFSMAVFSLGYCYKTVEFMKTLNGDFSSMRHQQFAEISNK
jgi:hypothetical protein